VNATTTTKETILLMNQLVDAGNTHSVGSQPNALNKPSVPMNTTHTDIADESVTAMPEVTAYCGVVGVGYEGWRQWQASQPGTWQRPLVS
jgi:hypothetical protein